MPARIASERTVFTHKMYVSKRSSSRSQTKITLANNFQQTHSNPSCTYAVVPRVVLVYIVLVHKVALDSVLLKRKIKQKGLWF